MARIVEAAKGLFVKQREQGDNLFGGGGGGGGAPAENFSIQTANYQAVANDGIFADSSGGPFTITLPASPALGDKVTIYDPNDSWFANNVTVDGGGSDIQGDLTLLLDENGVRVILLFNDTEWRVY